MNRRLILVGLYSFLAMAAQAHRIPSMDVETDVRDEGRVMIRVNLDIRLPTSESPASQPVVRREWLTGLTERGKTDFLEKSRLYLERSLVFLVDGVAVPLPELRYDFIEESWNPELPAEKDEIHLLAETEIPFQQGATELALSVDANAGSGVMWIKSRNGERGRRSSQVLFPGETGKPVVLPLATGAGDAGAALPEDGEGFFSSLGGYMKLGIKHIIGLEKTSEASWWQRYEFLGLDHILFVIGLFLLNRHWKPLLIQITAFTIAHSITLALGILGIWQMTPWIAESLIALSIVFVAVENLFTTKLHWWRTVLVFAFGLMHGMGFSGVLSEYDLPESAFAAALIGFNIGVECGQLAVVLFCFALVGWIRNPVTFHRYVAIPASAAIAILAAMWVWERVRDRPTAEVQQEERSFVAGPVQLAPGRVVGFRENA